MRQHFCLKRNETETFRTLSSLFSVTWLSHPMRLLMRRLPSLTVSPSLIESETETQCG